MTSKAHVRGSIRLASRERAVPVHREVPELFCLLYTALKLIVWVRAVLREESLVLRLDFLASWDLFFLMLKQDGQLFCLDSGCFQEDCYIVAFFFFSIKHNFFLSLVQTSHHIQIGLLVFDDLQNIWVWFPEKLTYADNIQRHPSWLSIWQERLLSYRDMLATCLLFFGLGFILKYIS